MPFFTDKIRVKSSVFASILILSVFAGLGCSPINNSKYNEYLSQKYEVSECNTTYNYAKYTVLTGSAKFYKRGVNLVVQSSELKNMTLGDPLAEALPIRFAEVAVYNSSNKIVQCGATNAAGDLKAVDAVSDLKLPKIAGNYTVRLFSRINRTLSFAGKPDFIMSVAVKKDKYTNEVYFISGVAASNAVDDSSVNLTAYARQTESVEIEGGAFNILNSIVTAYDYIRANTGTTDTTCLNAKFSSYWKAGFNPAQYVYPALSPENVGTATFYDKVGKGLYISGGKLGNINLEMTSHFDDYVIIHEFAHHVEDMCGSLISPGGNHYVIARVDPRLAWAEGWANYFSAQVMYNSINSLNPEFAGKMALAGFTNTSWTYFFSSEGFSDSVQNIGNGSGFMFDLKKSGKNPDTWQVGSLFGQPFDKVDPDRYPGEGHFREGAITRGLFKLTNNCGGTCLPGTTTPIPFSAVWKSMSKLYGMGQSFYPFKSSATFMEILKSNVPTWDGTYKAFHEGVPGSNTAEALDLESDLKFTGGVAFGPAAIHRWIPYGTYLTQTSLGVCTSGHYYIEPRPDDPVLTSTNSDERYSNHYYTIDLNALSDVDEISVSFDKIIGAGTGSDTEFDLLLFKEDYFFPGDYSCATYDSNQQCTGYQPSRSTNADMVKSDRRSGLIRTKTIRGLQALDHGKRYILDLRVYSAAKSISTTTEYKYHITNQAGNYICP